MNSRIVGTACLLSFFLTPALPTYATELLFAKVELRARTRIVASGLASPTGLALQDDRMLYVSERPTRSDAASLSRIDLATGELTLMQTGPAVPEAFAANRHGRLYWVDPSTGALMTQGSPGELPAPLRRSAPRNVAVGPDDKVYLAGPTGASRTDAGSVLVLGSARASIPEPAGPSKTAVAAGSGGDLYWTSQGEGLIYHLSVDGRGEVLLAGLDGPRGIALDASGRTLYFTEVPTPGVSGDQGGRNTVNALDLSTLSRTVVDRGDPEPSSVAVSSTGTVYWTSTSRGVIVASEHDEGTVRPVPLRRLSVHLTGAEEVPPVETTANGRAQLRLVDRTAGSSSARDGGGPSGPELSYLIAITSIANVSQAEIRLGKRAEVGPVVAILLGGGSGDGSGDDDRAGTDTTASPDGFRISGTVRTADLVGPLAGDGSAFTKAFAAGNLYINVPTATHPGGEVRGQIAPPSTSTNNPPNAAITSPSGNVTIAPGGSVTFAGTASDPDGDTVSVLWRFGDGGTSTLLNPGAHTYAMAGTFVVTLTATDSKGLADPTPATRTITVQAAGTNNPPNATITSPSGNVTIAPGGSVTFAGTASDPDGDSVTVLWTFGDGGTSTSLNPGAHTYAMAGTFVATLTATDSKGLADPTPATRTITVQAAAPTLTQIQTSIFTPSCTSCHGAGGSAGLDLRAGQSFSNLVNVAATTRPGLRVVPGSPATSALVVQLQSGHRSVSAANQALIAAWITAGALNN